MYKQALEMLRHKVLPTPGKDASAFSYHREGTVRFVVAGCIHATRACPAAVEGLVTFIRLRQPDVVCLNGDLYDLECFMGSKGGEGEPAADDIDAGLCILRIVIAACREVGAKLVFLEGNHEARLSRHAAGNDEIRAIAAHLLLEKIRAALAEYEDSVYVPYDGIYQGYRICGINLITHGTIFNQQAPRDMAEMYALEGVRYVWFNHTHGAGLAVGRRDDSPVGFNCGNLLRRILMSYSNGRRQSFAWSQAFGIGVTDGSVTYGAVHIHPHNREGETWDIPNWPI